jgi:hypothetical protein
MNKQKDLGRTFAIYLLLKIHLQYLKLIKTDGGEPLPRKTSRSREFGLVLCPFRHPLLTPPGKTVSDLVHKVL